MKKDESSWNDVDELVSRIKHFGWCRTTENQLNFVLKSLRHNVSEMQKEVNRLRKKADEFRRVNDARKEQLTIVSKFMDKLLAEGRVTRAELKAVFPKRRRSPRKEWKW